MTRYRPLFLPLILTMAGLAVLLSLGKWQLDRRDWKLDLIERIEERARGETVSLSSVKRRWEQDRDVEYYRALLVGRFLHEYERHLYGIVDGQAGWRIVTPFQTDGGDVILVDRGVVPEELKEPSKRSAGRIEGTVELVGVVRKSEEKALFTPDNQPAANRWFWRDVEGMTASLPEPLRARALPFMAEAEASTVPGGWPRGGATRLDLPNRHLEYALTWFGLAGALIMVFALFARHRLRDTPPRGDDARIADQGRSI